MRRAWLLALPAALLAAAAGAQPASLVARGAGFALGIAGLVVLTGWSGQLNLHIAAVGLGWGAYAAAGLAANGVPALLAILVAPLLIAPAALLVALAAVRFRGLELAIATFATGLLFEQMAFQNLGRWLSPDTGGTRFDSTVLVMDRPELLSGDRAFAVAAVLIAAVWLVGAAALGRGRPGRTLRVIRDREVVAEARGVPVVAWRVAAFVVSSMIAAAGGAVLAAQSGAVTPQTFNMLLSLQMLAIAWIAGIRRIEAALVGAAVLIVAQEASGLPVLSLLSGDRADLFFGVALIVVLALQSRRVRAGRARPAAAAAGAAVALPPRARPRAFAPTVLRVEGVRVSFGGLRVLDGVHLRVGEGEVCGLVGGNGAGKTTLFNCITGLVQPDEGAVFVGAADVTEMAPHRRAALGVARTFQGVEVFEGITVEEGLMVSAGFGGDRGEDALRARAHAALAQVGIADVADARPEDLPFAVLRLVEVAHALVSSPNLVLLDEPLAGLDAAERARVLAAVAGLAASGRAVLLVEHDLASVEAVADRVYELRAGVATERVLAREPVTPAPPRPARRRAPRRASRTEKGERVAARL